jgi:hypothetical protein
MAREAAVLTSSARIPPPRAVSSGPARRRRTDSKRIQAPERVMTRAWMMVARVSYLPWPKGWV